ncbi:MAG: hypothetical protein EXR75_13260 [Myxococcales bacterium]|nr:hypothetical protein [Myxococcales bacterium]
MGRTIDDLEAYLTRLDRRFERELDTFLLPSSLVGTAIAISVADSIVMLDVDIGMVPADAARQLAVFRKLLEHNVTDLLYTSYGVERDEIVLSGCIELENLDLNELSAILADIELALAHHVPALKKLAVA